MTPWSRNGTKLKHSARTKIYNGTEKKMERLFNSIPKEIRNIKEKNVETFKKHLDKWLKTVPDTPRIDDYGSRVAADSNSIVAQAAEKQKKGGDPNDAVALSSMKTKYLPRY